MKLTTFVRLFCSAVIGGTLAHRGIYWYEPSFWVICIASAAYAIAAQEDNK